MREEKRSEIIHDALNQLDDELILEADMIRKKTGKRRYITMLAASVAVFLLTGTIWNEVIVPNQADEGAVEEIIEEDNGDGSNRDGEVDEVIIENCEEVEKLNDVTEAQSQVLQESQEQIHLPNQKVENLAELEALAGVQIPAWEVSLAKPAGNVEVDMLAFFIYEGRCYVQDQYYEDGSAFVGAYVGTAVGLLDEWTTEDGYVDYAGSVTGKFYEVKGYDTEFMLCMKFDDGAVETFINNNGISLGKGSDLIEDRLHLTDNVEKVTFKTPKEWNESFQYENSHILSEEYDALINRVLESFRSEDFMYIKDTPLELNGYHENKDNYHLSFHTKDGLQFGFVLYEDGYMRFQGVGDVCVQIDPSLYEELITVFKAE